MNSCLKTVIWLCLVWSFCSCSDGSNGKSGDDSGPDGSADSDTDSDSDSDGDVVDAWREPACDDSLDYQCGQREICERIFDYGQCDEGYECVDNLCMLDGSLSCDDIDCASGEHCFQGVCLLVVSGETRFVATWGDDSSPGTFESPFYSWQKAADVSQPGDITYFRGGVWFFTEYLTSGESSLGMIIKEGVGSSGTETAPIRYFNFPGERPILDGRNAEPSEFRWSYGVGIDAEFIHLKGLTIRHIYQDEPDFTHPKPHAQVSGVSTSGANHLFENISVHHVDGRGFEHWSSSWTQADAQYAYDLCVENAQNTGGDPSSCTLVLSEYATDDTTWINCDAYNLFDWSSDQPGNAADGWKVGTNANNLMTWKGCRAWSYSDDGFDPHGSGARVFDSCWAMSTHNYEGIDPSWNIEGNGYKIPAVYSPTIPTYQLGEPTGTKILGCIATDSIHIGFYNDIFTDYDDIWPNNALIYNNLAYSNGHGFRILDGSDVRNNISYGSQNLGVDQLPQEIVSPYVTYPASNNTWIPHDPTPGSWPFYEDNPDYDVGDDDFVSLDFTELTIPRKKDGSLPDVDFGHLASGSELIDGAIVVEGYHCETAGAHTGSDCREWYGAAPDLGPFEVIQE